MRNVYLIIKFTKICYCCVLNRSSINCTWCSNFNIIADNYWFYMRNFMVFIYNCMVTKSITSYYCPGINNTIFSNNCIIVQYNIIIYNTIISNNTTRINFYAISNKYIVTNNNLLLNNWKSSYVKINRLFNRIM